MSSLFASKDAATPTAIPTAVATAPMSGCFQGSCGPSAAMVPLWRERLHQWSADHPATSWREWNLDAFWERVQRLDGGHARSWTEPFLAPWVAELRTRGPET